MKAMIFAAGLGTRLRPFTNDKPKALVELNGEPIITGVIKKLTAAGVNEIIVNLHHFSNELKMFLDSNDFNVKIQFSDESHFLLDTGGGLKNAAGFVKDGKPFFAYNVDVLSDINLNKLFKQHIENKSIATLAVRNRLTSRYLLFDKEQQLSGWENINTNELRLINGKRNDLHPFAFSGIQVIDPSIFDLIAEFGKFSIIDVYLKIANSEKVKAYIHDEDYWFDLGTVKQLQLAECFLNNIRK